MHVNIPFIKAQGLGNDFILIATSLGKIYPKNLLVSMADRRLGIGCDQVVLFHVLKKDVIEVSFFNADGSEAGACGNGSRALANYLFQEKGAPTPLTLLTKGGELEAHWVADNSVALVLPHPKLVDRSDLEQLPRMPGQQGPYIFVDVGNPHLVCFVDQMTFVDVTSEGLKLSNHSIFNPIKGEEGSGGVNVSFACCRDRNSIDLAVWERGAGFTGACGTAACAVMAVATHQQRVDSLVTIHQQGGDLLLSWEDTGLRMTGSAQTVFEGGIDLARLTHS